MIIKLVDTLQLLSNSNKINTSHKGLDALCTHFVRNQVNIYQS